MPFPSGVELRSNEYITYSIVIPAYNEGARLGVTLEKVVGYVSAQGWNAEVIVVNDGSRDNTAEIARGFAEKNPMVRVVENPGNRGKGYSVRNGMLNARGEVVVFSDADLSSPIEEMPKLLQALAGGADIAIGSRWLRAELQTQRQSLHRQLFGRIFNLLQRMILGLRFKDTQCGFKAFTRRAAQTILPLQRIERWGFDPEILFSRGSFVSSGRGPGALGARWRDADQSAGGWGADVSGTGADTVERLDGQVRCGFGSGRSAGGGDAAGKNRAQSLGSRILHCLNLASFHHGGTESRRKPRTCKNQVCGLSG